MKEIQLTQGYKTIVDDDDFEYLSRFRWYAQIDSPSRIYAARSSHGSDGKTKHASMHRVIMNTPPREITDHINGDGLDNRKSNLRIITHADNLRNRHATRNNTSGYRGVTWDKQHSKWMAKIKSGSRYIYVGRFDDVIEAAIAYDKKAKELWGDIYSLPNIKQ